MATTFFAQTLSQENIPFSDIDSFTAMNSESMKNGSLEYLAGKYSSSIGPVFALVMDAIDGNVIRDPEGNAVSFTQGYLVATDAESFDKYYVNDNGDTPIFDKASLDGIIGQDVTFELTADVTGSVEASEDNILTGKLSRYAITDTYEKGLTFKPGTVEVKFVNDTTTTSTTDFKVEEGTGSFKVALGDDTLKGNDFYSYKKVVVTYKATLNKDAKIGKEGNENADGLEYKHNAEPETAPVHEVPGNTVYVFTLKIDVTKVDAATKEAIKVAGVKFALFGEDKETKIGEEKETDAEGKLSFVGLDKGTYYVQETKAPEGYNLNTSKHEVKLVPVITADATGKYTMELDLTAGNSGNVTVEDTKSEVPTTGGVGTMMFTVVGGALIIAAGVLLVIVLKKRAK